MNNHINIIGAGAVGGFFAGLLSQSGLAINLLTRTQQEADSIKKNGLHITSPHGNSLSRMAHVTAEPQSMTRGSFVIVALKSTLNNQLAQLLPLCAQPDATIIIMQNGLDVERAAQEVLPNATIIGCLTGVSILKQGPGKIIHNDYCSVSIGQWSASDLTQTASNNFQQAIDLFKHANIPVEPLKNIVTERWKKLLWTIPFQGLSTLFEQPITQILKTEAGHAAASALIQEIQAAAQASGHDIPDEAAQHILINMQKVPFLPSMLNDLNNNKPLELEALFSAPIRLAQEAGYDMKKTAHLLELLRCKSQINE